MNNGAWAAWLAVIVYGYLLILEIRSMSSPKVALLIRRTDWKITL